MKMKKVMAFALASILMLGLSACSNKMNTGNVSENQWNTSDEDRVRLCEPRNLLGRWVSEDKNISFLVYMTEDMKYRIRMDLENTDTDVSILEGKLPEGRAYIGYIEVLADTEKQLEQFSIYPLEIFDGTTYSFKADMTYWPNGYSGGSPQQLGTTVFTRDTSLMFSGELSSNGTAQIMSSLEKVCNDYYSDVDISVVNVEIDMTTRGIFDEPANYDGYIYGTGIIAPHSDPLNTHRIEFKIDPSTTALDVYSLNDVSAGESMVFNYEVQQ